jgi:hypothetical protein
MRIDRESTWSVLLAFLVAFLLLYVLLYVVGLSAVLAALRGVDPPLLALAFSFALVWMTSWSYTMFLVFGVLEIPSTRRRALLVYLSVLFVNNVAPFSVGGGEPIAALLVSRSTRSNYETSLLSVVSTDVINFLPAPLFAFLGLIYVGTTTTLGRRFEILAGTLLGLSVLLVVLGIAGWRYRRSIEVRVVRALVSLQQVTARRVPHVRTLSSAALQTRVASFVDGLERVAADRRALLLGVGSSAFGWVMQAAVLWTSLYAVGVSVPVEVPVFVVSLVTVTDLVPLPGGIGSVDAAIVGLLVAVTGVSAATAAAAALVFRSATLLFSITLGGVVTVGLHLSANLRT